MNTRAKASSTPSIGRSRGREAAPPVPPTSSFEDSHADLEALLPSVRLMIDGKHHKGIGCPPGGVLALLTLGKARPRAVCLNELSGLQRHTLVASGLEAKVFRDYLESFELLRAEDILQSIGIATKTLQRREADRLNPRHSDAAMALIEVTTQATEVLGSQAAAEKWLASPAVGLGGMRPIDLLTSTPGIESVKDLLGRIEFGVYA